MIAILEGDVSVVLEGRSYRLTAHQAIMIPPIIYHIVTANKPGTYRRMTALFDISAVPTVLQGRFGEKVREPITFSSEQMSELGEISQTEEMGFYSPLANSLMIRMIYNAIRATPPTETHEPNDFLKQIIQYVDEHLCERIHLDALAAHTARSKSSVCHLFEEKMGISPKQYILQKKMALANKLIRDGVPPTQAAMQVGYQDYSAFYRAYRKYFQVKPSNEI